MPGQQAAKQAPEKTTVSGKLSLLNGRIALQSGSITYYVSGLSRLIGFVDGLKEGAQVSLEGYAVKAQEENSMLFRSIKLSLNGKDYDLVSQAATDRLGQKQAENAKPGSNRQSPGPQNFRMMPGPGPMMPGYGMMKPNPRQGFGPRQNQNVPRGAGRRSFNNNNNRKR
jgi:hypothetical protein